MVHFISKRSTFSTEKNLRIQMKVWLNQTYTSVLMPVTTEQKYINKKHTEEGDPYQSLVEKASSWLLTL